MMRTLGLLLIVALGAAACTKTNVGEYTPITSSADIISKFWTLNDYRVNGSLDTSDAGFVLDSNVFTDSSYYRFNKDRTVYFDTKDNEEDSTFGNWYFSNSMSKLNVLYAGDTTVFDVMRLDANQLKLKIKVLDSISSTDTTVKFYSIHDQTYIPYKGKKSTK